VIQIPVTLLRTDQPEQQQPFDPHSVAAARQPDLVAQPHVDQNAEAEGGTARIVPLQPKDASMTNATTCRQCDSGRQACPRWHVQQRRP